MVGAAVVGAAVVGAAVVGAAVVGTAVTGGRVVAVVDGVFVLVLLEQPIARTVTALTNIALNLGVMCLLLMVMPGGCR